MKNPKKEVIKALKGEITSIDEAIKFLQEEDGAEEVISVDWKWEVRFEDKEQFEFWTDEDLIAWTNEQKQNIEECK